MTSSHGLPITALFGQPFSRTTFTGAVEHCGELLRRRGPSRIVTANVDFLARASKNKELRKLLFDADEILCDGMPLVWSSRCDQAQCLPERVAGSDLVPALLNLCQQQGHRVFFFGSDSATLQKLQARLRKTHPQLQIAGAISPPMGSVETWENEHYLKQVTLAKTDLLLVALGFPKQDLWIQRFAHRTKVKLSIGIGASLDFLVGKQTRAPRWVQRAGMEWLWRLSTDPKRLTKRYLSDFSALVNLMGKQILWKALSGTRRLVGYRRSPHAPLLNGIRLGHTHVVTLSHETPADYHSLIPNSLQAGRPVIIDCRNLNYTSSTRLNQILEAARFCRAKGCPFALFAPPSCMTLWLHWFGCERLVPHTHHPKQLANLCSLPCS